MSQEYTYTSVAVIVLALVFLLIAVRQVGRFSLKIWQVMLGGALAVLITGQIGAADALAAINTDVMLFLFGMFVVGEALVQSGYLAVLAYRLFGPARNPDQVILVILFGCGLLSAVLMNDTIAIIGTPLVLALAARSSLPPKLLLLALAFAITTGSVMSPIGNPQNLLVAIGSGLPSPFVTFAVYLVVPTILCLAAAFAVLRTIFAGSFSPGHLLSIEAPGEADPDLAFLARCSLAIILVLSAAKIVASLSGTDIPVTLPLIALCAAAPVLLLSRQRFAVLSGIDWPTLVFFAAMFVLMAAVWQSGFFQGFVDPSGISTIPVILALSVVLSQFISNVPFVALFQPVLLQAGAGTSQLMALAAGSTIAGNMTILGAASNVIIIQNAEKSGETLTFMEFARIGIPLTIIQILVYGTWLMAIS